MMLSTSYRPRIVEPHDAQRAMIFAPQVVHRSAGGFAVVSVV
jgi:hypothetical protein